MATHPDEGIRASPPSLTHRTLTGSRSPKYARYSPMN